MPCRVEAANVLRAGTAESVGDWCQRECRVGAGGGPTMIWSKHREVGTIADFSQTGVYATGEPSTVKNGVGLREGW